MIISFFLIDRMLKDSAAGNYWKKRKVQTKVHKRYQEKEKQSGNLVTDDIEDFLNMNMKKYKRLFFWERKSFFKKNSPDTLSI